jgi:hypothetical protein
VLSSHRFYIVAVCATCILLSCTGKYSGTVSDTSYAFDLDTHPVTDIVIGDEHRITLIGQDDLISAPWYITVTNRVIFLNDLEAIPLRILDKETHEVVRSYGKGSGPGEFNWISGIAANRRHVVVAEMGSSMNTYFNHMGVIDSMAVTSALYKFGFLSFFAVNDSIFTSGSSNPDYLIQLNSLYSDEEPVFLKERVIPLGHQPDVYNWPSITLSDQYLAFSITGLPEITFADLSGREKFSITVTSEEIRKIKNPPVVPVETSEPMRVQSVFSVLKIIGNRLYIYSTGSILNIIEIDFEDPARSRIIGRFRFMIQSENEHLKLFGLFSDLDFDGKDLYFTHRHSSSIYRLPFALK